MSSAKRNTKFVLIGIACVILLGNAWLLAVNLRAKAVMEETMARYAKMGEELSIDALAPKVEASQSNGAKQMLDAIGRLPRVPRGLLTDFMAHAGRGRAFVASRLTNWPAEIRSTNNYWVSNTWDEISDFVEPNRNALGKWLDSATNDVIVVDLPYEDHVELRIPHSGKLGAAMRLSVAAILLDLHEGRRTEARAQLLAVHRFLARYDSEPSLISQLTRQSSGAIRATWDALNQPGWKDEELKKMQETLASVDYVKPVIAAVRMDRAAGMKAWSLCVQNPGYLVAWRTKGPYPTLLSIASDLIAGKGDGTDLGSWAKSKAWSAAFAYEDAVFFMDACQSNVFALQDFSTQRSLAGLPGAKTRVPKRFMVSSGLIFDLRNFFRILARTETLKSLCLTAIAIKRFELRYGQVPAVAEDLVGEFVSEIPTDWYDGKAIRYVRDSEFGFRLWSVGMDGIDGGGHSVSTNAGPLWDADMIWPMPATAEEVARKRAELEARMAAAPKRP